MEKLSIEEKARRYDEAIREFKPIYDLAKEQGRTIDVEEFERIFPELKESEDERIRKEILKELKEQQDNIPYPPTPNEMARYGLLQRWMDWLKQDEQKPIDKVESIFNIGDTIVKKHNSNIYFTITDITGGKYWYNDRIICNISEQDEWEIYEPTKSAEWSEEDEEMWLDAIKYLELLDAQGIYGNKAVPCINWLKSLKDHIPTKIEWSEEDKKMFVNIKACLRNAKKDYGREVDWLLSLRPQKQWKPSEELMKALTFACIKNAGIDKSSIKALYDLKEQLKRL